MNIGSNIIFITPPIQVAIILYFEFPSALIVLLIIPVPIVKIAPNTIVYPYSLAYGIVVSVAPYINKNSSKNIIEITVKIKLNIHPIIIVDVRVLSASSFFFSPNNLDR